MRSSHLLCDPGLCRSAGERSRPIPHNSTIPAIERRMDGLLSQMTLGEKIGQLVHDSAGIPTDHRSSQ